MLRKLVSFMAILFPAIGMASEPDFQFRTPIHLQRNSMAAWAVVPDWTAEHRRILLVIGPYWRHEEKSRGSKEWVEVLAGLNKTADRRGHADFILNVRALYVSPRGEFYAEALRNFRAERTTFLLNFGLRVGRRFRVGGETEIVFGRGQPQFGIGPRFALPFKCGPARCSIAGTYFVKRGGDVLRAYTPVNF